MMNRPQVGALNPDFAKSLPAGRQWTLGRLTALTCNETSPNWPRTPNPGKNVSRGANRKCPSTPSERSPDIWQAAQPGLRLDASPAIGEDSASLKGAVRREFIMADLEYVRDDSGRVIEASGLNEGFKTAALETKTFSWGVWHINDCTLHEAVLGLYSDGLADYWRESLRATRTTSGFSGGTTS
jgi:hypothetical protein